MNIDAYLDSTRRLREPRARRLPGFYSAMVMAFKEAVPVSIVYEVIYSTVRHCSAFEADGELFVVYDQYMGQSLSMLNRILLNSSDVADSRMYALKVLAEKYHLEGLFVPALTCAAGYAALKTTCASYKNDKDVRLRSQYTLIQEVFVIAHEVFHLLLRTNRLYGRLDFPNELQDAIAHCSSLYYSVDFIRNARAEIADPLRRSDFEATLNWQGRIEERVNLSQSDRAICDECFCDIAASALTAYICLRYFQFPKGNVGRAVWIAFHHLRWVSSVEMFATSPSGRKDDGMFLAHFRRDNLRRLRDFLFGLDADLVVDCHELNERHTEQFHDPIFDPPACNELSQSLFVDLAERQMMGISQIVRELKNEPEDVYQKVIDDLLGSDLASTSANAR